jgi:hypothetical protein
MKAQGRTRVRRMVIRKFMANDYLVQGWRCQQNFRCKAISNAINPDYPLGRHSGEGRNPVIKDTLRSRHIFDFVSRAREVFNHLDSGFRRNDGISANGQSGINVQPV